MNDIMVKEFIEKLKECHASVDDLASALGELQSEGKGHYVVGMGHYMVRKGEKPKVYDVTESIDLMGYNES
jgi:hypothetical protein